MNEQVNRTTVGRNSVTSSEQSRRTTDSRTTRQVLIDRRGRERENEGVKLKRVGKRSETVRIVAERQGYRSKTKKSNKERGGDAVCIITRKEGEQRFGTTNI